MSTPTVLIPGLYSSPRLYAGQIAALWSRGPVLVADHTRHEDVEAIAREILSVAPPRFTLVGMSLGGYIALAVQRAVPDRVERLALLDTAATPEDDALRPIRLAQIELAREQKFDEILDQSWPLLVDPSNLDNTELRGEIRKMYGETEAEAAVRQQRAIMARPDARPGLGAIEVPTLVLVGENDQLTPPRKAIEMASAIPGAELVTVPRAGHLTTMERPAEVSGALLKWLSTAG